MLDFFKEHPDEPVSRSVGLTMDGELRDLLRSVLEYNLSVALVSSETREIIEGRIISVKNKNDTIDINSLKSELLMKYVDIMTELDRLTSIFEYFKVDDVIHFFGFGVHKKYRHRGIGEKLMRAAVFFYRNLELGDVVIKGEGTSNFSKRVFEKVGFEVLAEVVYADYKVDGKIVIHSTGEHKTFVWAVC